MGAVSGLSDVELPVVTTWIKEGMKDLRPTNRRLAMEALGRNDDRLSALLDLIQSGAIQRDEVPGTAIDKLRQSKNPLLRTKAQSILQLSEK
jgi:hypothetical protein